MSFLSETASSLVVKLLAATGAGAAATTAAVELVTKVPERLILGIPQSVLMVAIVGALIGVLILPDVETDRVSAPASAPFWRRLLMLLVRVGALGGVVIAYALVAAWLVSVLGIWFPAIAGGPQLPLAGMSGVVIRRMLPKYLQVVERATEWVGGRPK